MGLSISGMGSGMDINSMVSQLMSIEKIPLNSIKKKQSDINAKISAYGQVKSALSKLEEATEKLKRGEGLKATKVSSSDETAVKVSSKDGAQVGEYSIEVTQLARAQRITTSSATEPTIGAGTLNITVGAGAPVGISVQDGQSIFQVRDAINAAFKDQASGVTAQVINNGTVNQLVISSKKTGETEAFKIEGTGAMTGFSFDPAAPGGDMTVVQAAKDAKFSVDGIEVTRASNTVSDVVSGVTLTLTKEATGPVAVGVAFDSEASAKSMQAFVDAYNDVLSQLKTKGFYDTTGKAHGTLNGDGNLRTIQSSMRSAMTHTGALDGSLLLSDVGISFGADARMKFDADDFKEVMTDPTKDIMEVLVGTASEPGHLVRLQEKLESMLEKDGVIDSKTDSLNAQVKRMTSQMDDMEYRLERKEAQMIRQFTSLDQALSSMMSRGSFLSSLTSMGSMGM